MKSAITNAPRSSAGVEQPLYKGQVAGSIPAAGTNKDPKPHLHEQKSLVTENSAWRCTGGGTIRWGATQRIAYERWLHGYCLQVEVAALQFAGSIACNMQEYKALLVTRDAARVLRSSWCGVGG